MRRLCLGGLLISFILNIYIDAKDPELPLCPTNVQYFPQNLPMHCRLPGTIPPFPSQIYQNLIPGQQPTPISLPQLSGSLAGPMSPPMSMPIVPMPAAPAPKLPVIVMPFYSPDAPNKKPHTSHQSRPRKHRLPDRKKRPKYYKSNEDSIDNDSSTDDESNDNSSDRGMWRGPRAGRRSNRLHKRRRKKQEHEKKEILTPILQYVTKDGYVIFEKQISKGEAKDWLVSKTEHKNATPKNEDDLAYELREKLGDSDGAKSLGKDVEEIKVNTKLKPQQMHKIRESKRKLSKKS